MNNTITTKTHGTGFLARAQVFFSLLKSDQYPNATSLAELCQCSRNTSQRTIYRLRDEFLMPLEYDGTKKGYYLRDSRYELPQILPPGRDELTALLLAREMLSALDAPDVLSAIDKLWHQMTQHNPSIQRDLAPLTRVFSSSSTSLGKLSDEGVLQYLLAASAGENVQITYRSPWRGTEAKIYRGRILHVHYADARLYLKFWDSVGREIILNASFIEGLSILEEKIEFESSLNNEHYTTDNWLEGFGVWAGKNIETVEIRIKAPAAYFFAKQVWHEDQSDSFENDVLIRRMPAIVSPELVSRVMSIGRHVVGLRPESLREAVLEEVRGMGQVS